MNRNAFRMLALSLALTGLAACASTGSPDLLATDVNLESIDRIPSFEPDPDADFDGAEGADEAIEALSKGMTADRRSPWPEFTLGGSVMLVAEFDTELQVGSRQLGVGTKLQMEDLLGLDDSSALFRLDFLWRINRSNLIGLSWYDIRRDGRVQIKEELEIGDEVFPAGARVKSELNTAIYRFNYWWNFVKDDDYEVGVGIGVYWMSLQAKFAGQVIAGEGGGGVDEKVSVQFPPPLLGLRGAWAITDRLRLTGTGEILYVPIDQFEGWIADVNIGLRWDVLDFAGLSLGYNFFTMGVDADMSGLEGRFDYRYHALLGGIYFYW
jgi:hypothetical protein